MGAGLMRLGLRVPGCSCREARRPVPMTQISVASLSLALVSPDTGLILLNLEELKQPARKRNLQSAWWVTLTITTSPSQTTTPHRAQGMSCGISRTHLSRVTFLALLLAGRRTCTKSGRFGYIDQTLAKLGRKCKFGPTRTSLVKVVAWVHEFIRIMCRRQVAKIRSSPFACALGPILGKYQERKALRHQITDM